MTPATRVAASLVILFAFAAGLGMPRLAASSAASTSMPLQGDRASETPWAITLPLDLGAFAA